MATNWKRSIIVGSLHSVLPLLAGCTLAYDPTDFESPKPDAVDYSKVATTPCRADQLQHLVGEYSSVLNTVRFRQPIRVERPEDAYTQEFNAERVRFILDDGLFIRQVKCG